MSAPASTRSRVPSAETTLPATTGTWGRARGPRAARRASAPGGRARCRRRARRRPPRAASAALAFTSPLTPMAAATRSRRRRRPPAGRASSAARRCGSACRPACRRRRPPGPAGGVRRRAASNASRGSIGSAASSGSGDITWCTWANRSTPAQSASVTTPTGRPLVHDDHRAVRPLGQQRQGVADRCCAARASIGGVDDQVALLHPAHDRRRPRRPGCPAGAPRVPPRRATVSAIRRPATAVMLATTSGMVAPLPSVGGEVDVVAGGDVGAARHHEDVVVGQVVRRRGSRKRMPPVSRVLARWPGAGGLRHRRRGSRRPAPAAPPRSAALLAPVLRRRRRRPAAARGRPPGRRPGPHHEVVWLTGRPEWLRATTTSWLARHGLPARRAVPAPEGDYRPAPVYKLDGAARARRALGRGGRRRRPGGRGRGDARPGCRPCWPTGCRAAETLREAQDRLGRT